MNESDEMLDMVWMDRVLDVVMDVLCEEIELPEEEPGEEDVQIYQDALPGVFG